MDLNHRPLGYEPNELPDCSTPRNHHNNRTTQRQTPRSHISVTRTHKLLVWPQFFSFGRWHASTILVGSMAALSNCSSRIVPSLPIRKFTRRAALYLSR